MRVLKASLVGALVVAGLYASSPAEAHSGGKAVVLVQSLTLSPEGRIWQASAQLVDGDSGSPIRGADVKAIVGSPARTIPMNPGATLGRYSASLGALAGGPTHLQLSIRTLPGSNAIVPYDHEWDFNLTPDQAIEVAKETSDGGETGVLIPAGIGVAILAVGGLCWASFATRRRRAKRTPAQPSRA